MPVADVIPPGVICFMASGSDEGGRANFEVSVNLFALIAGTMRRFEFSTSEISVLLRDGSASGKYFLKLLLLLWEAIEVVRTFRVICVYRLKVGLAIPLVWHGDFPYEFLIRIIQADQKLRALVRKRHPKVSNIQRVGEFELTVA